MRLVSIVGEFFSSVAPVFFNYKDEISEHFIICDEKHIASALKFKDGVKKIKPASLKRQSVLKLSSVNQKTLDILIKNLNPSEDMYINATDGLSVINTYLSHRLLPFGVKFISYDIFKNSIKIVSKDRFSEFNASVMSVEEHLNIKNFEIVSREEKEFFLKHSKDILSLFENYFDDFITFKNRFLKTKSVKNSGVSSVERILKNLGLYGKNFNGLHKIITGGLFEGYVFLKLKKLGFDDIETGVSVKDGDILNEFDILAMKNNHLNIIECKNKPLKNFDLEKLIYKYTTLRERIDYDAKAAIITLESDYTSGYKKRAKIYSLGLFGIDNDFEYKIQKFLEV